MEDIYISGTGVWTPPHKISNDELVESFNKYVDLFNAENADQIENGSIIPLEHSSSEFIVKASGIKSRYVIEKDSLLNPQRMKPLIKARTDDELSFSAEVCVKAAKKALKDANLNAADIDCVIVSAANLQRAYPAVAIEVQNELGIEGFAYDMMVGCSASTFGISNAYAEIKAGKSSKILVISPEITSGHNNFKNRDGHFIFGDVCTAVVIEKAAKAENKFKIIDTKLKTSFSNNIRNNFGYMNTIEDKDYSESEQLFFQNGRRVFKEVMPFVSSLILDQLNEQNLSPQDIERYWLHQANINMNAYVIKKLLGDDFASDRAPIVLDEYANTSSAGSIIAFHKYNQLEEGQKGIICSFGAGYSICSILLEKA